MAITPIPDNNHSISLADAIDITTRYREYREKILTDEFKGRDLLTLSETFNKNAFISFFTNIQVKGLRIYYGMREDLQVHAIVVGVDENGKDMLPAQSIAIAGDVTGDNEILEDAQRCPPTCMDVDSPLSNP